VSNPLKKKIVITGPLVGSIPKTLADPCDLVYCDQQVMTQDMLNDAIVDAWGVVTMTSLTFDKKVMDSARNLKIISNLGVGCDNVDMAYAAKKGITVTNTPDAVTEATADMAFTLMLAAARHVGVGDRMMRAGQFEGWKIDLLLGRSVHGKTLGILGCGRIGQAVARRAFGFNMKLLYHNRRQLPDEIESSLGLLRVSRDQMLAESDFIVITAPLNDQTRHFFTLDTFKKMKPTAMVVNVGRGAIIKEDDLVTALQQKLIAGAALDVLETPPTMARELENCPNTILTPHLGSATYEARTEMCESAIQAIIDVLAGKRPKYVVNV